MEQYLHQEGKCGGMGPDAMFPELHYIWKENRQGEMEWTVDQARLNQEETEIANRICNGLADGKECPVRAECLSYAFEIKAEDGVFGGLSSKGRRKYLRQQKRRKVAA